MKSLALALAFFLVQLIGHAQETDGVNITITIDNVLNDNGKVMATLHTEDTFMKGPGIQNLESSIEDGKVSLTFKNVTPGTYAIMALHDTNENRRMDYQENGMPSESYGMSGNEMSLGPPNFVDAKFEVAQEDLEFNIRF
ncbi:DUF2141 domain-containing protein [Flagellimonas meridianipacifica]|uniref:Uncharacterized protein (DUF2141 family) n=1 Tax=Flagellimonas meridianipacifica TaxID=1080225 RepID=A0A2T0MA13_9FLAO|nr:DUF2141 domain-containing protein [Allomuricauda pacifica]PRX54305.1 uncharacterized protein (DUF2141 family) [Allomuricauda pacifica]